MSWGFQREVDKSILNILCCRWICRKDKEIWFTALDRIDQESDVSQEQNFSEKKLVVIILIKFEDVQETTNVVQKFCSVCRYYFPHYLRNW